jgi:hypothetical protein
MLALRIQKDILLEKIVGKYSPDALTLRKMLNQDY